MRLISWDNLIELHRWVCISVSLAEVESYRVEGGVRRTKQALNTKYATVLSEKPRRIRRHSIFLNMLPAWSVRVRILQ